ncbi:MAG: hypothetical protein GJ677_07555 [Rhodobacteraceae bacterium]|nr:hypothetical protein [Paracoccaceae bacterium]
MARSALLALSVATVYALAPPVASAFVAQVAQTEVTKTDKQRYALAEALRLGSEGRTDAKAAFGQMHRLAESGYGRAQARLAYYHLKGIGTEVDQEAAARWYRAAIEGGRESARASYAKLLMAMEQPAAALEQLDLAAAQGIERAQALRAAYHYQNRFGPASDPAFGREELTRFAKAGDLNSMRIVLAAMQAGARFDVDAEQLLQRMVDVARTDTGKTGGRAAESLLRLWRGNRDADVMALRAEMVAHESLRGRARAEDQLYLARDSVRTSAQERAFRTTARDIVKATDPADFQRAFVVVARLDKNAYVYVLQEELKARGYETGPATGVFNTKTLQAVTQFCKDTEMQSVCRLGPLRGQVIKAVIAALAEMPPTT